MTDRWSQPKSKSLDLGGKVDDFARNKTVNKDAQARTPPPKQYLTTTNTPRKHREAVDELSRVMKAQNHGSPTQSKFVRPLMSPQKPKGNPISIPKTTITTLDYDVLRSPPQQQRRVGSLDRAHTSPSPRKPVSRSIRRTVEPVSSLEDMPDTFEEFNALSRQERERLGGERGFKIHLEKLQQRDKPAHNKKCRGDSSSESKHRAKDRPSLSALESIGPPSSDSEEDDNPFKDVPARPEKSIAHSKKTVSTGASISAGSTGSTESTGSLKLGANRPLTRTAIEKPALLLTGTPMAKADSIRSTLRRNSDDYGSDDFEEDRLNRKNKDASTAVLKSTARSYKLEEDRRLSVIFFNEIGSTVRAKDFVNRSLPQNSNSSRVPVSSDKSRKKDSSQHSVEDRGKDIKPRKKIRSPAQNVIDLSKDVDSHPIRSTSATKRTRDPQSSGDSESELESIPTSKGESEARPRALSPPIPARAVASRDDSEGFRLPSPNKTKDAGGLFILPSPSKKKSCYESPSGYMSNQVIYMLSDDDIPRKVIEDDNVCPYCGDLLPEIKSKRLSKALAKIHAEQKRQRERKQEKKEAREHGYVPPAADVIIVDSPSKSMPRPRPKKRERKAANGENGNEESDSDSRRRRESQRADYDPFGSPPPSSLSSPSLKDGTKLSLMDRFEFCRVHIADEQIVPHGVEQGYPVYINFDKLEGRVRKMESELRGVVEGTVSSPFLEKALSNYERMGVIGARNPHFVLAGVRQTLPGYYGSKGSSELFRILAKMFLESQFLTHEKAHPQKPSEYIQHVLVPEAGVRLIAEDRNEFSSGDPISLERAREIMMESVEFGSYMHDIDS